MTKQYPAKKQSIPKERKGLPTLEPTQAVTKDLAELPAGSAVLQCILSGDSFTVRSVLIGATEMDLLNPAHRFIRRIFDLIPQIMEDVNGGQFVAGTNEQQISEQLGGDEKAIHDAVVAAAEKSGEFASLMDKPKEERATDFLLNGEQPAKFDSIKAELEPEPNARDAYVERADARTKQADDEAWGSPPETSGQSSEPNALEPEQPGKAIDLARGSDHSALIYSSPNCVFKYCPHPERCETAPNGCVQAEFKGNAK